jgi:hypothetical protein
MVGSSLLLGGVFPIANMMTPVWGGVFLWAFFVGHFAACCVVIGCRGRLDWPPNKEWFEIVVVVMLCWLGPLVWLDRWRRRNR